MLYYCKIKKLAGIYLHIPFCKQACIYCNFHFVSSLRNHKEMIEAMLCEIDNRKDYIENEEIESIYFGGGTPSLLDNDHIERFLDKINKNFNVKNSAEITLEANPDDLNAERLKRYRKIGINRLSIGIQSFDSRDLIDLKRIHSAVDAIKVIKLSQDNGIDNLSIDLIYGLVSNNPVNWEKNLNQATLLNVPHISCYALTVEERTILSHQVKLKEIILPEDESVKNQFEIANDFLTSNGYEAYEISNFALPGMYSKHNTSYWQNKKYLGIGPSAHSYDGESRSWNIANNAKYVKAIKEGLDFRERECLSHSNRINEAIMTGLRTKWGVSIKYLEELCLPIHIKELQQNIEKQLSRHNIYISNDTIHLQTHARFFADGIASNLFVSNEE